MALRGCSLVDDVQRRFEQEARRTESLLLRVVVVVVVAAEVVAQLDDDAAADCGAEFAVQIADHWSCHPMHDDYTAVAVADPSVSGSGHLVREVVLIFDSIIISRVGQLHYHYHLSFHCRRSTVKVTVGVLVLVLVGVGVGKRWRGWQVASNLNLKPET